MKTIQAVGAYATILFHDDNTSMEGLYFHFGDLPEDDINDDNVFFYAEGEHEMQEMMKNGALDFKVLSYELHYE